MQYEVLLTRKHMQYEVHVWQSLHRRLHVPQLAVSDINEICCVIPGRYGGLGDVLYRPLGGGLAYVHGDVGFGRCHVPLSMLGELGQQQDIVM